jgi:two-component system cell cycle response regulator
VEDGNQNSIEAEETVFTINHTLVGTETAKNWGFPEALLLPIQYHHNPEGYTGKNRDLKSTIQSVYLSDLLVNILFSDKPEMYHKQFRKEAGKRLGLTVEDIEAILEEVHVRVKEAGTFFNLKIKGTKSVQEILQEANIRLSLINLDYDQMNKELILAKIHLENLTKELEDKNTVLDNLANVDGLTGLYNHRYFQNVLDQEVSRCMRHGLYISIVMIDIDHFKKFNDTYGHQVGDFVLAEFSSTILDNIRQYDVLARYGGEEFAMILPETKAEEALIVAEKLRAIIEETLFQDNRETYHVTASFGLACSKPATEDTFDKNILVNQADQALYAAKEKGRNQVASYSPKKKWYSF